MPRPKTNTDASERIQLQLGAKLKSEVMELCQELDTNVSRVIRERLRTWVTKQRRKLAKAKAAEDHQT